MVCLKSHLAFFCIFDNHQINLYGNNIHENCKRRNSLLQGS